MRDDEIVELFWQRSEDALTVAKSKYSRYCYSIAFGILRNHEDAEECVSDTLSRAWNAIPPARPSILRTYLGKITRNLSLNYLEKRKVQKRGFDHYSLILSELDECIEDADSEVWKQIENQVITQTINGFLSKLSSENQKVFVRRYWYLSSIKEIANDYVMSESKVKSILFRLRKKLKTELEKEGVFL